MKFHSFFTNRIIILCVCCISTLLTIQAQNGNASESNLHQQRSTTLNTSEPRSPLSLKVNPVEGIVHNTLRFIEYNIVHDTHSKQGIVIPNDSGETIIGDLGVNISGSINENVSVDFDLPNELTSESYSRLQIQFPTFDSGSGFRLENNTIFNPNITNTFNLFSSKTCSLRLGYKFTVLDFDPDTITYYGIIKCRIHSVGTNRYDSTTIPLTIRVAALPLTIEPVNGDANHLIHDTTYTIEGGRNISPNNNHELVSGDLGVNISGVAGYHVLVKMDLPHALISDHGDVLYITFPNVGKSTRLETGTYFNPNVLCTFYLLSQGTCQLRLGYTFRAPTQPGTFIGMFRVTIEYTSLAKTKKPVIFTKSTIVTLTLINDGVTGVLTQEMLPDKFKLEQNYPNPFNPVTKINFSVPTMSDITLKIFDMLGKEVTTLTSQEYHAGKYTLDWDASDQPSGMYLCRLQSGSFIETKKIILMK